MRNSFLVFSVAVSMSMLASSLGCLIAASYSTFCKFFWVWFSNRIITEYHLDYRWA